jgi:hypothetical protein
MCRSAGFTSQAATERAAKDRVPAPDQYYTEEMLLTCVGLVLRLSSNVTRGESPKGDFVLW